MKNTQLVLSALDRRDLIVVLWSPAQPGRAVHVIEVSDAFCRMSGLSRAEVVGMDVTALAGPGPDRAGWDRAENAIRNAEAIDGEVQLPTTAGRSIWLGYSIVHVDDPVTGFRHAVMSGRDITQARIARQESAEMQALLGNVFMLTDVPVVLVRSNGMILVANARFEALLGYSRDELTRMHVQELTLAADVPKAAAMHAEQLAGVKRCEMPIRTVRRDGSAIAVRLVSCLAERPDQQRFRVVTLHPEPPRAAAAAPPPPAAPLPSAAPPPAPKPATAAQVGKVQTLAMDAIRAAYGAGWEPAANRLLMLAEGIIKRRLGLEDVYSRTADQGFVIWFAEPDPEIAAAQMAAIAREIRIRLLGEFGETPMATVTSMSAPMELPSPMPVPKQAALPQLATQMKEMAAKIADRARETVAALATDPPAECLRVRQRDGKATDYTWVDLPRQVANRLDAALSTLPEGSVTVDLDMLRLRLAVAQVGQTIAAGRNGISLFPLSCVRLMQRRSREALLGLLHGLAAGIRTRLLPLLTDIPADMDEARLQEGLQWLAPLVRSVGLLTIAPELPPAKLLRPPFSLVAMTAEPRQFPAESEAFTLFAKARQKGLGVLARPTDAADAQTWRELGATMLAIKDARSGD